jgi:hypothetical protein
MLHGHDGPDVGVGVIKHAGWRSGEGGEGDKSGENSGRKCYESTEELTRF